MRAALAIVLKISGQKSQSISGTSSLRFRGCRGGGDLELSVSVGRSLWAFKFVSALSLPFHLRCCLRLLYRLLFVSFLPLFLFFSLGQVIAIDKASLGTKAGSSNKSKHTNQ